MFRSLSSRLTVAAMIGFLATAFYGRYPVTNHRVTSTFIETTCTVLTSEAAASSFPGQAVEHAIRVRYVYAIDEVRA